MRDIVLKLLAEKLINDFYAQDRPPDDRVGSNRASIEQLKACVPKDKWEQLFLVESRTAELGAEVLKRFSDFVAQIIHYLRRGELSFNTGISSISKGCKYACL